MTEKQKIKVYDMADSIMTALNNGYTVTDDKGNEVLGLRYNAKMNPNTWSYLYNNKSGHLVHGAIKYVVAKMPVCKKFKGQKPGKKPITIG